ncbi:MAG: thioredoxin family protein [Acidobacteriota bacterium]|nr:thioredoxin family protein [Acidobacteriota bacterium]
MSKFIYILSLFILGSSAIFAQTTAAPNNAEIKTVEREKFDPKRVAADDLKSAIAKATAENKRIILDVGGEWCVWCREMDNFLIRNAALGNLRADNFVWVKVNMSEENENKEFLANYPEIKGYPQLFVLEKDGTLVKSKDTAELEDGKKSYNLQKFTDFLKEYAPAKTTAVK